MHGGVHKRFGNGLVHASIDQFVRYMAVVRLNVLHNRGIQDGALNQRGVGFCEIS